MHSPSRADRELARSQLVVQPVSLYLGTDSSWLLRAVGAAESGTSYRVFWARARGACAPDRLPRLPGRQRDVVPGHRPGCGGGWNFVPQAVGEAARRLGVRRGHPLRCTRHERPMIRNSVRFPLCGFGPDRPSRHRPSARHSSSQGGGIGLSSRPPGLGRGLVVVPGRPVAPERRPPRRLHPSGPLGVVLRASPPAARPDPTPQPSRRLQAVLRPARPLPIRTFRAHLAYLANRAHARPRPVVALGRDHSRGGHVRIVS